MGGSMDGSISSAPHVRSCQSIEELKHIVMCTKLELESTRAAAKAQSQVHKAKVEQLEELLRIARRERDEAVQKFMELQSSVCSSSISAASFIADSPLDSFNDQSDWFSFPSFENGDDILNHAGDFAVSSFEEYGLEEPVANPGMQQQQQLGTAAPKNFEGIVNNNNKNSSCLQNGSALASILTPLNSNRDGNNNNKQVIVLDSPDAEMNLMLRNLPERGKLLQAVMQAGPLLHTLLLAGPLPQWHHPPPGLHSFQFPAPVLPAVSGSFASSSLDQHQHHQQQHHPQQQQQQHSCLSDGGTKSESLDCYSHRKRQLVRKHDSSEFVKQVAF